MRPAFDTREGVQDDRGNAYLYRTHLDEQGQAVVERVTEMEEVVSRARRIRYTRHFFPESTAVLRARLFAVLDAEELTLDGQVPTIQHSLKDRVGCLMSRLRSAMTFRIIKSGDIRR